MSGSLLLGRLPEFRHGLLTLLGVAILAFAAAPRPAAGAPPPPAGKNVDMKDAPVGVPQGSATKAKPWVIDFTTPPVVAGGAPVTQTVTVDDLKARMPGESLEAASKRKADTLAAAVNGVLGAGRAAVTQKNVTVIVSYKPVFDKKGKFVRWDPVTATFKQSFLTVTGLYTVPDTPGKKGSGTPAFVQKTNPTLEYGDGASLVPGVPPTPGSTSPGTTGSMSGKLSMATGLDPLGEQSFVDFGIDGLHVAGVLPVAGESDFDILQLLAADLNHNGVQASFDSSLDTLFILAPFLPDQTIIWSNTDTGLDFQVAIGLSVPEPAAWALMILGFGLLGARLRQRRGSPVAA